MVVDIITVYKDHITVSFYFDGIVENAQKTKIPQSHPIQSDSTVFMLAGINPQIDTINGTSVHNDKLENPDKIKVFGIRQTNITYKKCLTDFRD